MKAQRGVVLVVAMLVLLAMAIIATAVARTNLLQLHMAGNDEAKTTALQHAMAVVDAVLARADTTPVDVAVGHRLCAAGSGDSDCDETTIVLNPGIEPATGTISYTVTRQAPRVTELPVVSQANASSAIHYRAATFEIRAAYDGTARGLGRAAVVQGVVVRLTASAL